jgi:hypothetical protein
LRDSLDDEQQWLRGSTRERYRVNAALSADQRSFAATEKP